jgi:hypothetical protein
VSGIPPFWDEKKQAGIAVQHVADDSADAGLMAAASDVLHAIETKNTRALKEALRAAFMLLESESQEEGSPDEE